jgi:hypothetical protein
MKRRLIVVLAGSGLVVILGVVPNTVDISTPDAPEPSHSASERATARPNSLVAKVNSLKTAPEVASGYERDKFDYRSSETRRKVLNQEQQTDGSWWSIWDNQMYKDASELDIDHTVALKEAWDSGANKWSALKRSEFANDTSNPDTLNAITDNLNQAKGSEDGSWEAPANRCEYVRQVAHIKSLWKLSVDPHEKSVMLSVARGCR